MQPSVPFYKKMDDIGRIVIPQEIRNFSGMKKGDDLKVMLNENGDIVVSTYPKQKQNHEIIKALLNTLSVQINRDIIACDKDGAVVAVGKNGYDLKDFILSSETISFFHGESKAVSVGNAFENSQVAVSKAFSFCFRNSYYIMVIIGSAPISEEALKYIQYTIGLLEDFLPA